jgi:hypothetical protein
MSTDVDFDGARIYAIGGDDAVAWRRRPGRDAHRGFCPVGWDDDDD